MHDVGKAGDTLAPMYDDAALAALHRLVCANLSHWGLPESAEVSLLAASENATFLIAPPGEVRRVLRVNRPGYHSAAELASELAWSEAVRLSGTVRTPAVLPGADGAAVQQLCLGTLQRHAILYEHVEGAAPAEDERLPGWFERLGRLTAGLHAQARRWRRPAGFTRKHWTVRTTIGDAPHWGDWRAAAGLDGAGEAVLTRAATRVGRVLAEYGMRPERFGLIHGDLRLANLLVVGNGLHVIDFDDCGFGWFAYDFAASISFIEHTPQVPALHAAWCDGYRGVAALTREELDAMPSLVMLRRLLLLAWLTSRPETPTARALAGDFATQSVGLGERYLGSGLGF